MKIDTLNNPGAVAASGARAKPKPAAEAAGKATTSDEVTLSSTASVASGGETVNAAKVQEIRQAIADGRFQINAGAIADRLIESARELVQAQRKA